MAVGCMGAMNSQEEFMSEMRHTGVFVGFALLVWLPMLMPNRSLKFRFPPIGIVAFSILILYTLVVIIIFNDDIAISDKIVKICFHGCFFVSLVGSYRWYSFNAIRKTDTYVFVVVFFLLLLMYLRIVFYAISNLLIAHLVTSYYLLYALPLVLFHKSWRWKILCIVLAFIAVFSSMKRGGALALVFGLLVYVFVYMHNKSKNVVKTFVLFVVALLIIIGISLFLGSNIKTDEEQANLVERFQNVEQDGGSNRDHVYTVTWHLITSQDMSRLVVGNGYNAVLRDSPIHFSAHNDFMEITYDYGLIGLTCYIVFTVSFFFVSLRSFRIKSAVAPSLCFQFSNFILLSNISHIFIYMFMPLVLLTYGISLGQMRYEREKVSL
jgi:hypothetical protein